MDLLNLKDSQAVMLLNRTPLGAVLAKPRLHKHIEQAGVRFGDKQAVNLLAYAAWLAGRKADEENSGTAAHEMANSLTAVAKHFSLSKMAVQRWAKVWPFGRIGPFDLQKVADWYAANREKGGTAQSEDPTEELKMLGIKGRQEVQLLIARRRRLKITNNALRGQLIDRAQVERECAGVVHHVKSLLLNEPRAVADLADTQGLLAPGGDAKTRLEAELGKRLDAILEQLATGLSDVAKRKRD